MRRPRKGRKTPLHDLDGIPSLRFHQRTTSHAVAPGRQALHLVYVQGNAVEPVLHLVAAATIAAHLESKMTVGLAETTIGIPTDHAMTETTSDLVVEVEVVRAKLSAAASHATIHVVPHPRIVIKIVVVTEVVHGPAEAVELVNVRRPHVVVIVRAPEAQTASTGTYLEEVLPKLQQQQQQ
jgi:hypothetical protein